MDEVRFVKMNGTGNDFVVLLGGEGEDDPDAGRLAELATLMCPRRTSVGADGLVHVRRGGAGGRPARMRIFNADGGEAEMCGNGLRAAVRLLLDAGAEAGPGVSVLTGRGVLVSRDAGGGAVEVDMGAPLAVREERDHVHVSMGNPHCVVFVRDRTEWDAVRLEELAGGIVPRYASGTNVEVALPLDGGRRCLQRTWERGVGETQACGTGACAVVVAGRRLGLLGGDVRVSLGGGELAVRWAGGRDDPVFMTGAVETAYEGTWRRRRTAA